MLSLLLLLTSGTLTLAQNTKRGITFSSGNNAADVSNFNQSSSKISWVYDWATPKSPAITASGVQFVPMQWGAGNIENLASTLKSQDAKIVLGFNEPDFASQSNIDPAFAAKLWMEHIEPLKASGIRLGAPAVSSGGGGVPWMTSFLSACSNCTFDFIPIHWYGTGVAGFYDYLWQMHSRFGNRTIWVTEYASTSLDAAEVEDFMNQTTKYMDETDWIERYAWFGYFRPENGSAYNMLDAEGGLNSLGKHYIGADTVVKSGPATNAASETAAGGPTKTLPTITVASGPGVKPSFLPSNNNAAKWVSNPLLCVTAIACVFSLWTWF